MTVLSFVKTLLNSTYVMQALRYVVTVWTGKNIDGSTVEVCLAKPVEKGSLVRLTRSPASGKLSPAVSCCLINSVGKLHVLNRFIRFVQSLTLKSRFIYMCVPECRPLHVCIVR